MLTLIDKTMLNRKWQPLHRQPWTRYHRTSSSSNLYHAQTVLLFRNENYSSVCAILDGFVRCVRLSRQQMTSVACSMRGQPTGYRPSSSNLFPIDCFHANQARRFHIGWALLRLPVEFYNRLRLKQSSLSRANCPAKHTLVSLRLFRVIPYTTFTKLLIETLWNKYPINVCLAGSTQ